MSFYVWSSYYKLEPNERFELFPYKAQSPLSGVIKKYEDGADIWKEVEAIAELAETSTTRTIGHILFDLVPLLASPRFFTQDWMLDTMNEYHWIKNWNVSPGLLDDISADRLDCWSIIENEINQIRTHESKVNGKENI